MYIEYTLYYILIANVDFEKIEEVSKKEQHMRKGILMCPDFNFSMTDGIKKYEETIERMNGEIKSYGSYGEIHNDEFSKDYFECLKDVFEYYKKSKNVDDVDFHTFVKYFFKASNIFDRTGKNSRETKDRVLDTILKYGIDIRKIRKDLKHYVDNNKDEKIVILTKDTLVSGDEFEGNDRHNDMNSPVLMMDIWKEYAHNDGMINLSLMIYKNNYVIGLGYVSRQYNHNIILIQKEGEPILNNQNGLESLDKHISVLEKEFGKEKFEEHINNIFKILSNNGVKTNFDYGTLREKMNKKLGK